MRNLLKEAFTEYVEKDGDPYDLASFLEWAEGLFTESNLRRTLAADDMATEDLMPPNIWHY